MPAVGGHWAGALEWLIASPEIRQGLVRAADGLLTARYGWDRLEASVLGLLRLATAAASLRTSPRPPTLAGLARRLLASP
jgi:hypothetical protein